MVHNFKAEKNPMVMVKQFDTCFNICETESYFCLGLLIAIIEALFPETRYKIATKGAVCKCNTMGNMQQIVSRSRPKILGVSFSQTT